MAQDLVTRLLLDSNQFNRNINGARQSLGRLRNSASQTAGSMNALKGAMGAIGSAAIAKNIADTVREFSKYQTVLRNVTGDSVALGESMRYLEDLSKKYNAEILSLTNNYSKFLAASKGTGMSLQQTRNVFEALTQASTFFNLSADETNGVMLALSQMMSKGKISAEELRGQLGERLPGAMNIMARALGVTMAQLDEMMKKGQLLAADVLPKFADQLKLETSGFDANTIEGSINKMKNTWTQMWSSPEVQKVFTSVVNGLSSAMKFAAGNIKNIFIGAVGVMVATATNMINKLAAKQHGIEANFVSRYASIQGKLSKQSFNALSLDDGETMLMNSIDAEFKRIASSGRLATTQISDFIGKWKRMEFQSPAVQGAFENYIKNLENLKGKLESLELEAGGESQLGAMVDRLSPSTNAATRSTGRLATAWRGVRSAVGSVFRSMVDMLKANFAGIMIGGITMVALKLKEWYDTYKKINNIQKDTIKDIESTPAKSATLDTAKSILKEIQKLAPESDKYKKGISDINRLLGTQLSKEEDIRKEIEKRQQALVSEARLRAASNKITALEEEKIPLVDKQQEYFKLYQDSFNKAAINGVNPENDYLTTYYKKLYDSVTADIKKYDGAVKAIIDKYKTDIVEATKEDVTTVNTVVSGGNKAKEIDVLSQSSEFHKWLAFGNDLADEEGVPVMIVPTLAPEAQAKYEEWKRRQEEDGIAIPFGAMVGAAETAAIPVVNNEDKVNTLDYLQTAATLMQSLSSNTKEGAAAWLTYSANVVSGIMAMLPALASVFGLTSALGIAEQSKIPFPLNIVAMASTATALAATVANIPKFEDGGIVGGNSYYGDKMIARVNSGEMILNGGQQANLFKMLNGGSSSIGGATEVKLRISGSDLVGTLSNYNKKTSRL